ncbi:MAG: 1-acyl-sn-glycerol-3-phosphate acyltransferase [bacterium]
MGPAWLDEPSDVEDDTIHRRRSGLAKRLTDRPHPSAMVQKFGGILNFLAKFFFAHVLFEKRSIDNIQDAESRGTVVYVMRSLSLFDYLYFNWAFRTHGLPLAMFANGIKTIILRGFFGYLTSLFRRPSEEPEEIVQALVSNDRAVFLFLEKPKARPDDNFEFSQKYLYRLVRTQRLQPEPIFVLPLLLVWEKRPDSKHPTILDDIFGTAQSPGFFRKGIYWFQTIWQSFVKFGQPVVQVSSGVNLQEFIREYPHAGSADASDMLREQLLEAIRREERVILGPTGETSGNVWREILARPELTKTIEALSKEEGVPQDKIVARARAQFEEIAAEPSLLMIKIFSSVLSFVWYRIYDGFEVDEVGMERVREVAKHSNIVLVPSHKSHIDYLVLSYIFYRYGMTAPLIAAGVNLSFWPMGHIFRWAGAFFIRRSFKGDPLYPVIFREYVIRMLEEGYPVEFFIEGTRSRTGKLIKPRYGMLDMVLRAFVSGRLDSVHIVPISVGYEKIIEEASYKDELLGGEKEKESLGGLLRAPRFLTSKYGRLYVEFNEPIDIGTYLDKYEVDRINPDESAFNELTVRLAHRIIYDINEVSTVTPTALTATILLNNTAKGIDRERFLRETGFLVHFLTQPNRTVRMSRTISDALDAKRPMIEALEAQRAEGTEDAGKSSSTLASNGTDVESAIGQTIADLMDWALQLFAENKQVKVDKSGDIENYSVPEDARLQLSYYRNNIVHHFVPEALLGAAVASFRAESMPLSELMRETLFLSKMFKFEWIYEEAAEFENVFMRTLRYFQCAGWLTLDEDSQVVTISTPTPTELEFFRRLVLTFLEAYKIVFSLFAKPTDKALDKKEIVDAALKQGRADYAKGEVLFMESLSKPTYENAIRLLEDWKILERLSDDSKKKESYRVSEAWKGESTTNSSSGSRSSSTDHFVLLILKSSMRRFCEALSLTTFDSPSSRSLMAFFSK